MTKQHEKILKKICDTSGMPAHVFWYQMDRLSPKEFQGNLLRGFLLSKHVLRSWFGEELAHIRNGSLYIPKSAASDYSRTSDGKFPVWKHHARILVEINDVSKILTYYHKHRV